MKKNNNISILSILSILIIAHLTFTRYSFVNIFTIALSIILISTIIYFKTIDKNDLASFVIYMFIFNHFTIFLPGAGGLFNIVAFICLIIFVFMGKFNLLKNRNNFPIIFLLFAINTISYFFNDNFALEWEVLGFITFNGILFMFITSSNFEISKPSISLFINSIIYLGVINLFILVNSLTKLIEIESPLFISFYEKAEYQYTANVGLLNSTELLGEYSLIMFSILIVYYFIKSKHRNNFVKNISNFKLLVGTTSLGLTAILSFSRVITILLVLSIIFTLMVGFFFKSFKINSKKNVILYSVIGILLFIIFQDLFDFEMIISRIKANPQFLENFFSDILHASGTSREAVFSLGLERITEKNWILGYGWSIPDGNNYSWFGAQSSFFADYHNLYLSIIPILGWLGLILLMVLMFKILFGLLRIIFKNTKNKNPLVLALTLSILFFLIDQYKVNAIRNSYFTLIMILFGIGNSLINTYDKKSKKLFNQ